jgi:hypothetical protein
MCWRNIIILLLTLTSGCATQGISTLRYSDPSPVDVKNEIVVPQPFIEVWDGFVKELSKSFYVINNMDKESRIINVSFFTNSPVEYADCGNAHRIYTQGDKKEVYDYEVAGSSEYKVAANQQGSSAFAYYAIIQRETTLDGRANIYIAPDEKDKSNTIVTVNARYVITIKAKGEAFAEHVNGNIFSNGRLADYTAIIAFNTHKPGQESGKNNPKITCFSKGKLEDDILKMIHLRLRPKVVPKIGF